MKLVYITTNYETVQRHLIEAIKERGITTETCVYTLHKSVAVSALPTNVALYRSNSILRGPVFFRAKLCRAADFFLGAVDFSDVSILHGNMLYRDGYICRLIKKKKGIPYVVSVRDTDANLNRIWKALDLERIRRKNLLHADAIVFLSKPHMDKILAEIPEKERESIQNKCHIVPNGIDQFWFDNLNTKEKKLGDTVRFITVGSIEERKNQLLAAQAINAWQKKSGVKVEYTVIGNCKDSIIREKLERYSIVKIKEHMNPQQLLPELRQSDVFIMPSHRETFGLVYAEALTQGLPVIYSRGQGFDKQFEDGLVGYPVESMDVEDICRGIDETIKHYESICKQTIQASMKFKWSTVSRELINIYEHAINGCV